MCRGPFIIKSLQDLVLVLRDSSLTTQTGMPKSFTLKPQSNGQLESDEDAEAWAAQGFEQCHWHGNVMFT